MGIFNRTKDTDSQKILTIEDMKSQLHTNRDTIQSELDRIAVLRRQTADSIEGWENRVTKAKSYLKATDNPEALEALEILKAQAENFLEDAKQGMIDDTEYVSSLEQNRTKIDAALKNLEDMEKKEALNKHLQSVAEGLNSKALDRRISAPAIQDDKINDIRRLIHTTEALVEIRANSSKLQITSN